MSTQPAAPAAPRESTLDHQPSKEKTPWLLGGLCFLIPVLPTDVVLSGPLKSNGSPARMIAIIMFGLVALGFMVVRRTSRGRRVNPGTIVLLIYFLLWLLIYGVGLLSIDSQIVAANKTRAVIVLIADVGVGLFALSTVRTARQRKIVLGCLLAGLAFACLVGLLQSVSSVDLRFLFQPPGFVLQVEDRPLVERMGARRVLGTSQHPIEFSALAAVTIPLAIYFARNAATWYVRFLSVAACGLATMAMPAAISRTGVISLAAALLLYTFAFKVRQIIITVAAGAIMIGCYIIVFPQIANALWNTILGSQDDPSIQSRTEHYMEVSRIFRAHPVFGLGLGGAPQYYDNEWLQTIVQGGIIGILALILLSFGTAFGVSAALRRATTPTEREQAYMLGAVAVGILMSSTAFDLLYYQQATLVFFIAFGLLWGPFTVPAPESQHHRFDRLLSSCSQVTFPRNARRRAANAIPT